MIAELNFDGLVGPTHNYGGLAFGNVASMTHRQNISNPKAAALQGLKKMYALMKMGVKQAVLPPHERPNLDLLRSLGFEGKDGQVLESAARQAPHLLTNSYAAAAMWTANAATVSPSIDSRDGRVHLTPANLSSQLHRWQESAMTYKVLKTVFSDPSLFCVHQPLPTTPAYADEGAANHTRLYGSRDMKGIQLFVYGRRAEKKDVSPKKFPARHTLEASQAIARLHGLDPQGVVFAQQNPEVVDAGVFHNDVIAVGNHHVFLYHEDAYINTEATIDELSKAFERCCGKPLTALKVSGEDVSVEEAVDTYLFNSQILSLDDHSMALIAPQEACDNVRVKQVIDRIIKDLTNPIDHVFFFDLRESMCNGGGPACLRLRVPLTRHEQEKIQQGVILTKTLYQQLVTWVEKHYRDRMTAEDLRDPQLLTESRAALDALTHILGLRSIYPFQQ